jgi:hypothetical protein
MILRFIQGRSWISRLIVAQEKTAMPFTPSHVEALTPDGKFYLGAHISGGVMKRPIGYDDGQNRYQLLLTLTATPEQEQLFHDYLAKFVGEPYDWRAIIGFVLPRHEHDVGHAICSALITLALRHCRWFEYPLAAPAHLIDPRDLLLMVSARMQVPLAGSA